jgi:predicted transcriptional regulator of viral defense system
VEKNVLLQIFKSKSTILSFKEILLAVGPMSPSLLKRRLHYYIQQGELYAIRKGFYAKNKNYDRREFATKLFTPSYISFETVLAEAGVIFQYYSTIFVATYQSKDIVCDGQKYSYKKLKDTILVDTSGVENRGAYFIASPERAFLDVLYLNKNYYFDNLSVLNFDKILSILPIYHNKRMEEAVHAQLKAFKEEELS